MSRKLAGAVLHWVTVRDEDTTELLNSWSYKTYPEAASKKFEQEEAMDPPGRQTVVDIETLPTIIPMMPPKFIKTAGK